MFLILSLFLLIFSLLISLSTYLTIAWFSFRQKQAYLKQITDSLSLSSLGFDKGMDQEIEEEIDHRLEEMIAGFKKQIPMISMFLSKTKETELKDMAKAELLLLIPAIKERFLQKKHLIESGINSKINSYIEELWVMVKYKFLGITLTTGLILGLIEIGILSIFHS